MAYNAALINTVQGTAVAPEGREVLDRLTREHIERALMLDPSDSLARIAQRANNVIAWRWAGYMEALTPTEEREVAPPSLWLISWLGRHADAVRVARAKAALNPNDSSVHLDLGIVLAYAGDRAASTAAIERSLALSPANQLERAIGPTPPLVFLPELAYAYSRLGRADEAARLFAAIQSRAATADVGVGTWAMGYLAIGNEAEALRQLEAAAEKARNHELDQGYLQLMNLRMNFLADPRLDAPPFAGVLSRIRGD